MATTLGFLNPFRYRGYVYDEETGLYYLQSRYYNPEWGRFLNADAVLGEVGGLLKHNLFAYCRNNPANKLDPNGKREIEWYSKEAQEARYFRRVIIPRIMSFLRSAKDFSYDDDYGYKRAKYGSNGNLVKPGAIDCSHLNYEVTGVGSITARHRYGEFQRKKGNIFDANSNLQVELEEGMEVFKERNGRIYHCGILMQYDFGDGLEWAVFQSAPTNITQSKALFYGDTGPNITSFYELDGTTGWSKYTAPQY